MQHTREHNRLHAAEGTASTPRCILANLKRSLASLKRRLTRLRREAAVLIRQDDKAQQRFDLVISIPGIAEISAVHILGELAALSPEMSVREWVAHSGLDPAHETSGTSVHTTLADQPCRQSPPAPGTVHAGIGGSAARPAHESLL